MNSSYVQSIEEAFPFLSARFLGGIAFIVIVVYCGLRVLGVSQYKAEAVGDWLMQALFLGGVALVGYAYVTILVGC